MRTCIIIPTYNNDRTLGHVIADVLKITKDIIVVNDGSTDNTPQVLQQYDGLKTLSYSPNRGKGYAIRKGFDLAIAEGYNYAITLDADGQHHAGDIRAFLQKITERPDALIVGERDLAGQTVSKGSIWANRFSNFWYTFLTGIKLQDTQTGFRLYPLDRIRNMRFFTVKYEFELEVLVRAAWKGIEITGIPIRVYYPPAKDRVSHFRPFKDFARISLLNTVLVIIALLYAKPFAFLKYLKKENIREFISRYILRAHESNMKIALAIGFGVFMGIVPIWGFQLVTAIALAHLFRLSKFIVSVAANISIPPMIPFILYGSYITGGLLLGTGTRIRFSGDLNIRSFENNLLQYILGSIVFAVIMAIFAWLLAIILLKMFRNKRGVRP